MLGLGLVLLGLSFAPHYRYSEGAALAGFCRLPGAGCAGATVTRDAWHGALGVLATVTAVLGGACAAATLRPGRLRMPLAYTAVVLDVVAAASVLAAIAVIPDLGASAHDEARALRVSYGGLVTGHHAWGLWASLAVVLVATVCAVVWLVVLLRPAPASRRGA